MMKTDYGHWEVPFDFDPNDWFGFLYLITHVKSGKKYIGKKIFRHKNRIKVKGRKNRKTVIRDSNWRTYTGSSKSLNADIEKYGHEAFKFQIIRLCSGKCELTYAEEEYQFINKVLLSDDYYNQTLGSKNYRGLREQIQESISKKSGLI